MTANDGSLVQRQKDVIKLQDSIILDIESGVERLHGKVKHAHIDDCKKLIFLLSSYLY